MVSLQPKLSLKVSQRQILTPGLMQMVSVLALNKLELRDMIQAEITENPVLEELEESVPLLDHVPDPDTQATAVEREKADPFEEIDFGSYFQEYLDPGFRSPQSFELNEKPSIENYLSQPGSLSDHLCWQIGSLSLSQAVRDATEYIVGNLNEDGYLIASDDELLEGYCAQLRAQGGSGMQELLRAAAETLQTALCIVQRLDPVGVGARSLRECLLVQLEAAQEQEMARVRRQEQFLHPEAQAISPDLDLERSSSPAQPYQEQIALAASADSNGYHAHAESQEHAWPGAAESLANGNQANVNQANGNRAAVSTRVETNPALMVVELAARVVDNYLLLLQKRDLRELAKVLGSTVEQANAAFELIRKLDPRPGQRFNRSNARLIEPDVAFIKRDDEYIAVMDDESVPTLRVNQGYRRLLTQPSAEKDVKDYVKERYRSALQLMRNIEQRKNTILRTCEVIVRRQTEFLEHGVEALKPMMIKEVAEEIGVHPSTVSRAVSNKYVHTPQGVFELRFFFSEGVNGPEGSGTPLLLLKRKVKKLIEDEDPRKPLTDDVITDMLRAQGIDVTRRTVAKYREDLRIPSTHQRRVRD
jgi:RNA polymerase sigma-54 factor